MGQRQHAAAWARSWAAEQRGCSPGKQLGGCAEGRQQRLGTAGSSSSCSSPARQPRPPHLTWCLLQTARWVCGALLRRVQCETPHRCSQGTQLPAQTKEQAGEMPLPRVEAEPSATWCTYQACVMCMRHAVACAACAAHPTSRTASGHKSQADEEQLPLPPHPCTCGAMGRWKLSSRPCCSSAEAAVVRRSPTMACSSAWPRQRVYSSRLSGTGSKGERRR